MNIFIINVYALTENKDETDKDEFFEEVATIYDEAPGNTIKIIVGDCNAKLGKEPSFRPTIGMHSAHEISNNNGQRLINFAISRKMTFSSTTFPHNDIHKYTWKSPDGRTVNQIDHVLIDKRFRYRRADVRSYRGADCDTDHFIVVSKFILKLKKNYTAGMTIAKFNLENLKIDEGREKYIQAVGKGVIRETTT